MTREKVLITLNFTLLNTIHFFGLQKQSFKFSKNTFL